MRSVEAYPGRGKCQPPFIVLIVVILLPSSSSSFSFSIFDQVNRRREKTPDGKPRRKALVPRSQFH
jgi:hypothetical protein